MRAAKLAGAASALKRKSGATTPFSLVFMTDRQRVPNPTLIARVLPKGSAVILRDYDMAKREALAVQLSQICNARSLFLLIGADPALARRVGAKGLHMPSWFRGRNEIPKTLIVTASCHSKAQLERAGAVDADIALLSPAFPTSSHQGALALGAERFRCMAAAAPVPVLALGGINESNAPKLAGPNVAGLAAISTFIS